VNVAAIDCGTNTVRLLVASAGPDGRLVESCRLVEFAMLGRGVDATKRLRDDTIACALDIVGRYAAVIADHECAAVRFVATSAARDAANRDELLDGVRAALGPRAAVDVISGEEESRLSFTGATSGVARAVDPVLVMDSGGGSTELVRGHTDGRVEQAASVQAGSRRMRDRFLRDDPPTEAQITRARAAVRAALGAAAIDLEMVRTFIGVAGTVTTMAALALGLPRYDRSVVHGARLGLDEVGTVADRLLSLSVAQIAALGPVEPQRAEVLAAGALVVDEIAQHVRATTLVVSEADILDGVALGLLARGAAGHAPS